MHDSQKFTLNSKFKVEAFDNEILLYAVSSSKGVYLNETAYLVWEMCGKEHSVEEIIALLKEAYPEQKATIREDVVAALESLVENGALITTDE